LTLCFFAAPASAQQRPSISFASYVVTPDTYLACIARAKRVLESEGYTFGQYDDMHHAVKGIFQTIILCEPPGGSRYSFHIIVASGAFDGSVPGAERDKLARLMSNTNTGGGNTGNTGNTGGGNIRTIDWGWGTNAAGLNVRDKIGQRFTVRCPPNGSLRGITGTDIYEEGSSICTAAVHAGQITFQNGGTVTIEILPGQQGYKGSVRNGVTSSGFGSMGFGSFIFVGEPEPMWRPRTGQPAGGGSQDVDRLYQKTEGNLLQQIVGIWRRDNGSVIEIKADGTGVFRDVSEETASFGFKRGDVTLSGIRPSSSDMLEAVLFIRARKDECPTLEPKPMKASIKFNAERNTMSLTSQSNSYDPSGCRWTDKAVGTINHTYTRIQ
jgi:hypothetical protein